MSNRLRVLWPILLKRAVRGESFTDFHELNRWPTDVRPLAVGSWHCENHPILDYSSILANEARAVNLAITFTAPNTMPARPEPVAFVLVLDRSGSMGGAPLAAAKQSAIAVVRNLRPGDWFGLVTFDAHAETLVPFSGSRDQSTTIRTIEGIEPGGATNLTGGWSLGRDLLAGAPEQSPKKILLLTDGMANVGITEPDQITALAGQACERSRIRTSCLGFGDQYTEDLLRAMASASGGEQHDANDPEHLPAIFETELEQTFLTALEGQGGKSGNTRLRSTLGWDEDSYTRIKDALVNSGRIQPGKGRGGSVSIP